MYALDPRYYVVRSRVLTAKFLLALTPAGTFMLRGWRLHGRRVCIREIYAESFGLSAEEVSVDVFLSEDEDFAVADAIQGRNIIEGTSLGTGFGAEDEFSGLVFGGDGGVIHPMVVSEKADRSIKVRLKSPTGQAGAVGYVVYVVVDELGERRVVPRAGGGFDVIEEPL